MLSPSERDLIEVVHVREMNVRDEEHEEEKDGEDGRCEPKAPKPPKGLTPEEQARADALDHQCFSLRVCISMLERVNGVLVRLSPHPRNEHSDEMVQTTRVPGFIMFLPPVVTPSILFELYCGLFIPPSRFASI